MLDLNENYPIAIITSANAIGVVSQGDGEGQIIFRLRFTRIWQRPADDQPSGEAHRRPAVRT